MLLQKSEIKREESLYYKQKKIIIVSIPASQINYQSPKIKIHYLSLMDG